MTWDVPGFAADRLLGFGATGEVWAGRDEASGDAVALKRVRAGGPPDLLRREAALLAAFRHPNVIGLRGVLGTDEGLVLVMDLAAGSLAQVLAGLGRLRSGEVVGLFAPVADALQAAHQAGWLHGDVSLGNLLLDDDGTPLLADLGTARLAGDGRTPVYATSDYLDPAVRAGAPPTAASDVYALAAAAAHALTGRLAGGREEQWRAWLDHAHVLGVPGPLTGALRSALTAEPGRRPTADGLATAIRAACPAIPLGRLVDELRRPVLLGPVEPPVTSGSTSLNGGRPGRGGGGAADGEGGFFDGTAPPGGLHGGELRGRSQPRGQDAGDRPMPAVRASELARSRLLGRTEGAAPPGPGGLAAPPGVVRVDGVVEVNPPEAGPSTPEQPVAERMTRRVRPLPPGEPERPPFRWRRPVPAVIALVLLLVAGVVGWSLTRPEQSAPNPAGVSRPDWRAVLTTLDERRSTAFATADPAALDQVYLAGSPPLAADRTAVRTLSALRATAPGVRHELVGVVVSAAAGKSATLLVTDRMNGYRIVAADGRVLRAVPARSDRTFVVRLRDGPGGWRIAALEVRP